MDDLFTIKVTEQSEGQVECHGEMDICAVADLQAALCTAMRRHTRDLSVNMACVRYIDSACIKALLVARDAVVGSGGRLTLIDPSPAVRRALRLLSLEGHFGLSA